MNLQVDIISVGGYKGSYDPNMINSFSGCEAENRHPKERKALLPS